MCWPPASSPSCSWVTPLSTTGPPCYTAVSLAFCCDWTNPIHPHHHQLCGPSQHERSRLPKTEVCWTVQTWRLWKHVTATAQEKSISAQWGFLTPERQYAPRTFVLFVYSMSEMMVSSAHAADEGIVHRSCAEVIIFVLIWNWWLSHSGLSHISFTTNATKPH